jgi:hypothetical protein
MLNTFCPEPLSQIHNFPNKEWLVKWTNCNFFDALWHLAYLSTHCCIPYILCVVLPDTISMVNLISSWHLPTPPHWVGKSKQKAWFCFIFKQYYIFHSRYIHLTCGHTVGQFTVSLSFNGKVSWAWYISNWMVEARELWVQVYSGLHGDNLPEKKQTAYI